MGNYTWSKTLDVTEGNPAVYGEKRYGTAIPQQAHNLRARLRDLGDYDIASRAVLSYIYQVPVGRGRHSRSERLTTSLAGGTRAGQSLSPVGFRKHLSPHLATGGSNGQHADGQSRVNLSASPLTGFSQSIYEWFNTSVETAPLAGRWGDGREERDSEHRTACRKYGH